jgi:hypothetical protein
MNVGSSQGTRAACDDSLLGWMFLLTDDAVRAGKRLIQQLAARL